MIGVVEEWIRSPSKTLATTALAAVAGIAVHAWDERVWLGAGAWLVMAALALVAAAFGWNRPAWRFTALVVAAILFAWSRFDSVVATLPPANLSPPSSAVNLTGTITSEPDPGLQSTSYVLGEVTFATDNARFNSWPTTVRLYAPASSTAVPGDCVTARCKILPPLRPGGDWSCNIREPPKVIGRKDNFGYVASRWQASFKEHLRLLAGRLLPEPEASFLLGLLIGGTAGLPKELSQSFRDAGASHVLAVSGYNVTKVAEAVLALLAITTLRRRRAAMVAAVAIVTFAAVAGGEAAAVRAAIMGCLGCFAVACGRRSRGTPTLILAAAVLLLADPLALRNDIGFRLSFAAVMGMSALGKPLAERLHLVPEKFGLRQVLSETLGATIATLPIILADFGRLAWIGPPVNVLVLPTIPSAMAAGAVALTAGAIAIPLGWPAAWLTVIVLRFAETVVTMSARLAPPLNIKLSPIYAAILYIPIIFLWYRWSRQPPHQRPRILSTIATNTNLTVGLDSTPPNHETKNH